MEQKVVLYFTLVFDPLIFLATSTNYHVIFLEQLVIILGGLSVCFGKGVGGGMYMFVSRSGCGRVAVD